MSDMTKCNLMRKIQELSFACVDLNLYLDSHPDDKNAVEIYNSFSSQLRQIVCSYEKKYGPLTNFGYGTSACPWQWVNDPWPWENEFYE